VHSVTSGDWMTGSAPAARRGSERVGDQMGTTRVVDLVLSDLGGGQHRLEMRTESPTGGVFIVEVEGPAEVVDADAAYLGQQYGLTPHGELVGT